MPLITAVLGALGVIAVQWLKNRASKSEHNIDVALHEQDQEYTHKMIFTRLDAIEHKLDIHNGYAEKFGDITKDIAIIKTELANIKRGK